MTAGANSAESRSPSRSGPAASCPAPVITVDGPSGVGKGTLCRLLAQELGWSVLDSGAIYRLAALAALNRDLPLVPEREAELAVVAAQLDVRFDSAAAETRVWLDGVDVSIAIRSEACGNAASKVAALPAVRAALLDRQRAFREPPGLIADGRDMGTVVFADANVKFFLTASTEDRAERRYKQLKGLGNGASLAALTLEIEERDQRDASRSVSPLKPAADAITLDTTGLSAERVSRKALIMVRERL